MDTALAATVRNGKSIYSLTRYRDVIKKYAKGTGFLIFAIENQQKIHYAMPVRKMLYDALGYVRQCKQIEAEHKSRDYRNDDEFLSKFTKEDKLIPIFTIVLYYGEKEWDGPLSLMDIMTVDESIRPFIQDYKMDLIQVCRPDEMYQFHTEVSQFFQLMSGLKDLDSLHHYWRKHPTEYLDTDTLYAAAVASQSKDLEKIAFRNGKGGKVQMCTAIEELKEEGRLEGRSEGLDRVNQLILKLAEAGRTEEIVRAAMDRDFQEKLFKEFGL